MVTHLLQVDACNYHNDEFGRSHVDRIRNAQSACTEIGELSTELWRMVRGKFLQKREFKGPFTLSAVRAERCVMSFGKTQHGYAYSHVIG